MTAALRLATAVLVLTALAFIGPAVRADPVSVRAGIHEGYGRLAFNWPQPTPFQANAEGGTLTLRFGRPIEADLSAAPRILSRYIEGARIEPDGRTVVLDLVGQPRTAQYSSGTAVVVDLFNVQADSDGTPDAAAESGAPAETPGPPPTAATGGPPTIGVRAGEHEAFSRLVFDWPRQVGYDLDRQGDSVTVRFAEPGRLAVGPVRADLPRNVRGLGVDDDDGRSVVRLTVPDSARVRDFLSGPKVVIDVYGPRTVPAPPAEAETEADESAPAADGAAAEPVAADDADAPAAGDVAEEETPAEAGDPVEAADAEAAAETAEPEAAVPEVAEPEVAEPGAAEPEAVAPESAAAAPQDEGTEPPEAAEPAPAGDRPLALTPPGQDDADNGNADADPADAVAAEDGDVVVRLRFDWDEPVAAAVFRRGGALWVVFDKAKAIDLEALRNAGGNLIRSAAHVPTEQASALRLDTVTGVNPRLRRDGLAWILEFRQQAVQVATPIETLPQPESPVGARIFMPIVEPGRAIAVTDPGSGENLVVVPVVPLGHGIAEERRFPQVVILETVQGIVVRPLIDDLRVRSLRQGVELTSAGGLAISPVDRRLRADLKMGGLRPLTRVLDLEPWRNTSIEELTAERQNQQRKIAMAVGSEREELRFDLAAFYFSMGLEAEALGVLRAIEIDRPGVATEPRFRVLRGAINMLMGRLGDAMGDLDDPSLAENDEGSFWRAALAAERGDRAGAAPTLKRTNGILRPYPMAVKVPVGLLVAESAIEIGDVRLAAQVLDVLQTEEPDESQAARIDYVVGRMLELGGDFDGAIVTWEDVMDTRVRPARAKAAKARAELLMKTDEISREAGIEQLEELRFAWRGDSFEFNLLRRLGELYLAENEFREGLRTLRQAATYFRNRPEAGEVTAKMAQTFESIYLGDLADRLPAVTAIALYEEFKELTPTGRKGDEMVRNLAERLVVVDLLDQAADLLEAQVRFRLQGAEKASVGNRLAEIKLLDREADAAIAVLDETEMDDPPPQMAEERRYLRARALSAAGRSVDALALLKEDESEQADLLRLEVFWDDQDWPNAASVMRRVVDSAGIARGRPLDAEQAQLVLNLSVALTLAGNQRAVNRLRRDFGEQMDASPYREAFELIASDQTQGLADYRTIAGKVAVAENFKEFMTAYRERLRANGETQVN